MTLRECYASFGGDYDDVLGRVRREESIGRFLLKFPDDAGYATFREGLASADYEAAFRGAHTLKGVAGNLGLARLARSASAVCEALREGYSDSVPDLLARVEADYDATVSAIRRYAAGLAMEGGA